MSSNYWKFFVLSSIVAIASLFWGSWIISKDIVFGRGAIAFMWFMGMIAGYWIKHIQDEVFEK